jgi:hypothetical protein
MTLGGMVFGYVMCTVQSNSVSTSNDGLRRLRIVIIPFSLLIMLVRRHIFSWTSNPFLFLCVPVTGLWDISAFSHKLWAELREPVPHCTASGECVTPPVTVLTWLHLSEDTKATGWEGWDRCPCGCLSPTNTFSWTRVAQDSWPYSPVSRGQSTPSWFSVCSCSVWDWCSLVRRLSPGRVASEML